MANGADGSIVIDTELDSTGFQRGSKKTQSAMESLTGSMNQTGKTMQSAVQTATSALQVMGASAQAAGSKLTQYLGAGQFDKAMGVVQKSAQSLIGQLTKIGSAEATGVKTGAQFERLQANIEKAEQELFDLKIQMDQLGGQKVETPQFQQLTAEIEKAEAALFKLYDRRDIAEELGVKESSQGWQRLQIQIRNAEEELERLTKSRDKMQAAGTDTTLGIDTTEYQQLAAMYDQMTQALEVYKQAAADFNVIQEPANESTEALENVDQELRQKGPDAEQARGFLASFGDTLSSIAGTAMRTASGLAQLTFKGLAAGAKGAVTGIKNFTRSLKNLRSHSKQSILTSNGLVKALFGVKRMLISRIKRTFISSLFNSMKAGMTSFAKYSASFNAAMSSMKNSMTGLSGNLAVVAGNLVSAIAPAISTIIDWISKAITYLNAFFALLSGKGTYTVAKKGTDDYADSLKSAGGAAKDLKNQVYGFDELNKRTSDSGGGGGGGSGGGSIDFEEKAVNALPSSLLDFMQSIKDAFAAEQFEEVGAILGSGLNIIVITIDDWINNKMRPFAVTWASNIARILNGLVGGFDWTNLGQMFADGFNAVADTLNTFITTFNFEALAQGVSNGINGLFKGIDWVLLGSLLVNGFNSIWSAINVLIATFDFGALSQNIATSINGLFNGVNWALLGQTVGLGLQSVFNLIVGTIAAVNWVSLGSGLATGVNSMFQSINWTQAATQLNTGLKGVIDGINAFLLETDWQMIGNSIADFLTAIDWSGLVTSISTGIGLALGGLAQLIWGLVEGAWKSVVQWWYDTAYQDGEFTIAGLLLGIFNALADIGQWIFKNIVSPFLDGLGAVFGVDSAELLEIGGNIILGLLNGIITAISNIAGWVKENIVDPFINAFKSLFGIASPSTVMEEQGGYIMAGLLQGLTTAWASITEWVGGIVESFVGFFGGMWDTISSAASTAWDGISSVITGAWDTVSSTASTVWDGISTTVTTAWNTLSTSASTVWDGIKGTISTVWSNLSGDTSTTWQGIKNAISTVWTSLSTKASTTWNGITTYISNSWSKASESSDSTWSTVSTFLSTTWDDIKTTASTSWQGIKTTIVTWLTNARNDAKGVEWGSVGQGITTGTESGIMGLWDSFKSKIISKFKGLVSSVKSALGIHSPSKVFASIGDFMMQGLGNGVEDGAKVVMRTMSNIADAITEEMSVKPEIEAEASYTAQFGMFADKLTSAAERLFAAAQLLASMGGFTAPAIATGQAIPPRIKIPIGNGDVDASNVLSDVIANLGEQNESLDSVYAILREIRDLLQRLHLTIDADSLVDAITSLQKSKVRSYGGAY